MTVHLWRRYQDKTTPPNVPTSPGMSIKGDPFPLMNTDDWFDTYITCCVLHVPLA